MTIHLSGDRERFVRSLVRDGRYASESEVVEEALRLLEEQDLKRVEARERLDARLLEGLDSGPSTPMNSEDWAEIEREGERILAARKAS